MKGVYHISQFCGNKSIKFHVTKETNMKHEEATMNTAMKKKMIIDNRSLCDYQI